MTLSAVPRSFDPLAGFHGQNGAVKLVFSDERQRIGRVETLDAAGRVAASSAMDAVAAAIPCFTPDGTLLTDKGPRRIADLAAGNRIMTRDNGLRPILWVGARRFGWQDLGLNPLLRPVHIAAGALGGGLPDRDMTVSPNHRFLFVACDQGGGHEEAFVPARDLTHRPGVAVVAAPEVTYIQILFDRHEAVMSEGLWSESFQPGAANVAALGGAASIEVADILGGPPTPERPGYAAARATAAAGTSVTLAV